MKTSFLVCTTAVVLLAASCKGKQEAASDQDSIVAQKNTTEVQVQDSIKAEEQPLNRSTKEYEAVRYYRGETQNGFLVTVSMAINWPVSANGVDITPLQRILWETHFSGQVGNVQKQINKWVENSFPECAVATESELTYLPKYDPKKDILEQEPLRDPELDYGEETDQYSADLQVEISLVNVDEKRHLITYCDNFMENAGCGLGSCIMFGYNYFPYDYVQQKVLVLKDIVAKPSLIGKQLYKKFGSDYDGLHAEAEPSENFYITSDGKLVFIYGKYEIGCGADGCPELTLDPKDCPNAFTDFGKQLLGL